MSDDEVRLDSFDFTSMEGIQKYVEYAFEQTQRVVYHAHAMPMTVTLFSTRDEYGNEYAKVQPIVVGGDRARINSPTFIESMRKAVDKTYSKGVLVIHHIGPKVLFQLESPQLGDFVWFSSIGRDLIMGRLCGPYPIRKLDVNRLNLLPQKYLDVVGETDFLFMRR